MLQSCSTLCDPHGPQPIRVLCPQDSLGKNSGVGCHFLLQRGAWYQCILQWWSILAFQEISHLCILYNSYYMNWYKWLHICVCIYICIYSIYTYIYTYICMYIYMYIFYIYIYIYIYTYIYIHTHTHTHTHAHKFSSGFLNPGRVASGQCTALDHRS